MIDMIAAKEKPMTEDDLDEAGCDYADTILRHFASARTKETKA